MALAFCDQSIHGQTWNGGSLLNNSWSSGGALGNWSGAAAPVNNGTADVAFGGSARLTPNMDANWSILSLTFNSGAGAFTLGSTGAFTLTIQGGGITNSSTSTETINNAITLGVAQTWSATSGALSFGGNIDNGGFLLTIGGSSNTSSSGIISGTGGLTKSGTGTLTLSGANSYSGATTVSAGILNIQNATGLGTIAAGTTVTSGAALQLQGGIAVGAETLTLNGTGISSDGALRNISGNNSWAGTITINSTTRINSDSGTLTLDVASGNAITGSNDDLEFGGAGHVTVNDPIATTTGTLTKDGAGTLTFNAVNTYTGLTTISDGTLAEGVSNAISSGPVTVNGATAVLDLGANHSDTVGIVRLNNGGTITGTGTSTLTSTGTFEMKSGSVSAILAGSGIALNKTTLGTVTLTGANIYTGSTSVTAGTLLVTNTTGSGTGTGSVTVTNSGTTLSGGTTNGTGGISGSVNINPTANLSPGTSGNGSGSTAILKTGALTLDSTSNFNVDLNSTTAGTDYDQVSVTGTVNVSGSNLLVSAGAGLSIGNKFFIILNDGSDLVTGTFAQGATVTGGSNAFLINYLDNGDGGALDNDISLTVTAVPEPATWIGGALAALAIGYSQLRKRSRAGQAAAF